MGALKNYYIEISKEINKTKYADVSDKLFRGIANIVGTTIFGSMFFCFIIGICIGKMKSLIDILRSILLGCLTAIHIWQAKAWQKSLFNPKGFYDILTEKFRSIKIYVDTMKFIFKKIKSSPNLYEIYPNLYELYKDNLKFSENLFERKEKKTFLKIKRKC